MVEFILGSAGTGKSDLVAQAIIADLRAGIPVLFLVPEQMAIDAERRITDLALSSPEPVVTKDLEILNFTRLADRVFREVGGICYHTPSKGARTLIMWQTLLSLSDRLREYKLAPITPESTASLMLSAVEQIGIYGVSPARLEEAAGELVGNPTLCAKLQDLSLIASTYAAYLKKRYDDPVELLPRLCAALEEHDLFSGVHVYFDSFYGLTPQEFDVVGALMRRAKKVTFSLCLPSGQEDISAFAPRAKMFEKLRRMAGEYTVRVLTEQKRFSSTRLAHLSTHLFDAEKNRDASTQDDSIRIFPVQNAYEMAEQVARDIARRVRTMGCHYRDFAVVAADPSAYVGILDSYLARYALPYFLSIRHDMTLLPPIKLILSLLALSRYSYRTTDLVDLLRTGLAPLSPDEVDLVSAYLDTWSLSGAALKDEGAWTAHPRGYLMQFNEEDLSLLGRINAAKDRVLPYIHAFTDSFIPGKTVKELTEVLYTFLTALDVPTRLAKADPSRAALIWNTLMDALDELCLVCGDMKVNIEDYISLFTVLIKEMDIGSLPKSVDAVMVGAASLLRCENIAHVYLIGVNDGEFPASPSESAVFTEGDVIALEGIGITISAGMQEGIEEGLFHFWRCASLGSDSLTLLYTLSTPGGEVKKPDGMIASIGALFEHLAPSAVPPRSSLDALENPFADFSHLSSMRQGPLKDALRAYYAERPEFSSRLRSLEKPISLPEAQVTKELTSLLYPSSLTLSQSRLDDYVSCPFAYHCKHVLRLDENKPARIRPTDTGSFVHHILERFFHAVSTEDGIRTDLDEAKIETLLDEIIAAYLDSILAAAGCAVMRSERVLALFRRLRRLTLTVIRDLLDEFSHSRFVPTFFELPIAYGEEEAIAPLSIDLPSGGKVSVIGRIDRVDTYRRGDDVYIRVVDYKTGTKKFSLDDLEVGLNLQLLLYLFSISENQSRRVKEMLGIGENGKILPGGMLYCPAKPGNVSLEGPSTPEAIDLALRETMSRSGLLLYDEDILKAMDDTEGFHYLPIKFKKDGTLSKATLDAGTLQSLADFGAKMKDVTEQVAHIALQIKAGQAAALPLIDKKHKIDSCKYCAMRAVCRNFKRKRTYDQATKGGIRNE